MSADDSSNEKNPTLIQQVPKDLVQAGAEGKLAILVGAGASRDSGLPSWEALVDALFQRAEAEASNQEQKNKIAEVRPNEPPFSTRPSHHALNLIPSPAKFPPDEIHRRMSCPRNREIAPSGIHS